jgi:hypothetical protein
MMTTGLLQLCEFPRTAALTRLVLGYFLTTPDGVAFHDK